jgi:hypothetical protein
MMICGMNRAEVATALPPAFEAQPGPILFCFFFSTLVGGQAGRER